jgi:hypothetical protein
VGINATPLPVQTPPAHDHASAVVTGTLAGVGTGLVFACFGWMNVVLWGSVASALTTTAGSTTASVASGTGISAGMTVVSANVPPGTTWATFSGTSGTLAIPPAATAAGILGGTDNSAVYEAVAVVATVQLERTFDGGNTWIICGVGGAGSQAIYVNPQAISVTNMEPERGISYRFNCTAYTSGTINYRMSATGIPNRTFSPGGNA